MNVNEQNVQSYTTPAVSMHQDTVIALEWVGLSLHKGVISTGLP